MIGLLLYQDGKLRCFSQYGKYCNEIFRQALQKFGMNLTEDEAKEIIVSNSSISDNHLR